MKKSSVYNQIAKSIREDASALLAHIHQCVIYNAISEVEAKRLRALIFEFYNLSYNLEKK